MRFLLRLDATLENSVPLETSQVFQVRPPRRGNKCGNDTLKRKTIEQNDLLVVRPCETPTYLILSLILHISTYGLNHCKARFQGVYSTTPPWNGLT